MDVEIIGYPDDKNFGSQWSSYGTIEEFTSTNIIHIDAYVYKGNSGGPIINNGFVYGILNHSVYEVDSPLENSFLWSGGVRMYDDLFNIIIAEKNASAERWR